MKNNLIVSTLSIIFVSLIIGVMSGGQAKACTRVVYIGENNIVVTARSMDWNEDLHENLWAFPRGIKRNGEVVDKNGKAAVVNPIEWISKYGSVVASAAQDISTSDGMNEKGLVANLLYLAESEYVKPTLGDKRKPLSVSIWIQYFLDNYATVNEAVDDFEKNAPFYVVPTKVPSASGQEEAAGTLHVSISDSTGDSAIFEYIKGKLVIHHSKDYQVMTNSPVFEHQLSINTYWKEIGGTVMLPGTYRAADRFVRASYYINQLDKNYSDSNQAVAGTLSVIRNASTPLIVKGMNAPNLAPTIFRTLADHNNLRYFYESAYTPNLFWVDLKKMELDAGKPIKKLTLTDGAIFAGETSAKFVTTAPFDFAKAVLNLNQ
ncbi:Choloylglycine hydrolase [Gammaproteobacteria bacterium]